MVCRVEKTSPVSPQMRARNVFGALSHPIALGDSGEFVMLVNASPLPDVLPTFKKLLSIGMREASCFVSSNNRRSRKRSVSLSPSCSAPLLVRDIQQAGVGRNSLSRGGLWLFCSLSKRILALQQARAPARVRSGGTGTGGPWIVSLPN